MCVYIYMYTRVHIYIYIYTDKLQAVLVDDRVEIDQSDLQVVKEPPESCTHV